MLKSPMEILTQFPIRKTKIQKQAFLDAVTAYASGEGWRVTTEPGSFGLRNLVMGDPEGADFLITAHYDTCARMPIPNFITPCNLAPYLGYQLALYLGIALLAGIAGGIIAFATGMDRLGKYLAAAFALVFLLLLILGPANPSNANDNTSGVVTVLEILRSLPALHRHKVCFVLFDLEEAGLIGSYCYRKAHRAASSRQLVINLDCVGEGDTLRFFPTRALRKDVRRIRPLYGCCGYFGTKSLLVHDKGFSFYPSDQMNFPYGVGVAALKQGKKHLYLDRIHTPRDTCLDETNVNILRAAIISLITCGAVKKG